MPQQALTRDPRGNATVYVVGPGNKAVLTTVTAVRTLGSNWVVTAGLKPGDKVILQGTANARPGQPVKPFRPARRNRSARRQAVPRRAERRPRPELSVR